MKITESYISKYTVRNWDWGQYNATLKGNYKNEHNSEVKIFRLSEKEMEKYVKKFK